ncbi:FMN-binding protein [Allorhodopirellula solitaria]|uniref:Electron transport complex subunit RsxG n=1 Tax=Allorhodopirellula solitaria TaxID=2527987 RepID=A0A5C5XTA8_9BACT|nr:FMN-binding protein [Allorhodopirellula solitaria]TWT66487.1 Electron transport complex subunit RsxG [Allorhodopirellula solitaria]
MRFLRSMLPQSARRVFVHALRVSLFAAIILLIHQRFAGSSLPSTTPSPIRLDDVVRLLPDAASLGAANGDGSRSVDDPQQNSIGYVLQTSPQSDHIVGFSGPTNVLVAFNPDDVISGIEILSSGDTREHLDEVRQSEAFLSSFDGMHRDEVANSPHVDAVSGATLTSLAISESIIHRLGGAKSSLRFSQPLTLAEMQTFFPTADRTELDADQSRWDVFSGSRLIGRVIRSSPATDNIVGYQGPSDTLIGLDLDGHVVGFTVGQSYDNEPYVGYLREDDYFRKTFNGLSLDELATADLAAMQVEGVSGATMTSHAVAEGMVVAAQERVRAAQQKTPDAKSFSLTANDVGTLLVIAAAVVIGFTSLRANKRVRIAFQLVLVCYLGLTTGNLLSQAMVVGWAKHGVPWRNAAGLAMLAIAALACPIFTKRNLYCSHLCPHGAVQQLVKGRIGYQLKWSRSVSKVLHIIPALLLAWCLVVGIAGLSFSLVDIEPFDAYLFPIAGWATVAIAVLGIVASLFVPMAYCRFGCPTGRLLEYLRFNAKSDRWTVRDWIATGYLILAIGLWFA